MILQLLQVVASYLRIVLTLASVAGILSIHVVLSYWVRKHASVPASFAWLAGISLLTSMLWIGLALAIFYSYVDCCPELEVIPFDELLFNNTLGLPLRVNSVELLLLLPIGLFLLGTLVFLVFATLRNRHKG